MRDGKDDKIALNNLSDTERRRFLQLSGTIAGASLLGWQFPALAWGAAEDAWNRGDVRHIIPTANHERFLIKTSFQTPRADPPVLLVNDRKIPGSKTDLAGRFWQFDAPNLHPDTQYTLRLHEAGGGAICDAWPLKTFPAPGTMPNRLRILAYTCAGGMDGPKLKGKTAFLDMAARKRLLARGMSYQPDLVIANGDHIYWDIKTSLNKPFADFIRKNYWASVGGAFDISVPMLHPRNSDIYFNVCDYQIAGLYGVTLRSAPSFFLQDDHDMFENDEFDDKIATLPPDTYGVIAAEQTQSLYYPEFLPDKNLPDWLEGSGKQGRAPGTNMLNGTIRYGDLLEASLYDCRRNVDYKGRHAKVISASAERWLLERTRAEDTAHYFHAPSLPFAYSSGKLGDWYPDVLDKATGKLVMWEPKMGWQKGWFAQHQRLVDALSQQKKRTPMVVQGDFHASSAGKITRSGELKFKNPVEIIMTGTLGSGDLGYPSSIRAIESAPAQMLEMQETLKPTEKNGFTIIDVDEDKVTYSMYMWRPPQSIDEIASMEPALVYVVARR
jgi:hypothetical protein